VNGKPVQRLVLPPNGRKGGDAPTNRLTSGRRAGILSHDSNLNDETVEKEIC
jgi:hypothetical protein